eukprot:jgi/Bigna1/127175/aug1.4_g1883
MLKPKMKQNKFKRTLLRRVGGYSEGALDDTVFMKQQLRFENHCDALRKLEAISKIVRQTLERVESCLKETPQKLYDVVVLTLSDDDEEKTHLQATQEKLSGFINKHKSIQTGLFTRGVSEPLTDLMKSVRIIESEIALRQANKENYIYYLGKMSKLKDIQRNNLRTGKVTSYNFSEKYKRNSTKIDACKALFEKTTSKTLLTLGAFFDKWSAMVEPVILNILEIQAIVYRRHGDENSQIRNCFVRESNADVSIAALCNGALAETIPKPIRFPPPLPRAGSDHDIAHIDRGEEKEERRDGSMESEYVSKEKSGSLSASLHIKNSSKPVSPIEDTLPAISTSEVEGAAPIQAAAVLQSKIERVVTIDDALAGTDSIAQCTRPQRVRSLSQPRRRRRTTRGNRGLMLGDVSAQARVLADEKWQIDRRKSREIPKEDLFIHKALIRVYKERESKDASTSTQDLHPVGNSVLTAAPTSAFGSAACTLDSSSMPSVQDVRALENDQTMPLRGSETKKDHKLHSNEKCILFGLGGYRFFGIDAPTTTQHFTSSLGKNIDAEEASRSKAETKTENSSQLRAVDSKQRMESSKVEGRTEEHKDAADIEFPNAITITRATSPEAAAITALSLKTEKSRNEDKSIRVLKDYTISRKVVQVNDESMLPRVETRLRSRSSPASRRRHHRTKGILLRGSDKKNLLKSIKSEDHAEVINIKPPTLAMTDGPIAAGDSHDEIDHHAAVARSVPPQLTMITRGSFIEDSP